MEARTILLTALVAIAASSAMMDIANAADCRSNTECIPPVTTASIAGTPGENGWWRSSVVVTLVCTDNSGACGSTTFSVDGSPFNTYHDPFPVAGEGLHFIWASSADKNGNNENPELIVVRIDQTTPGVALTSPTAGNVYVRDVQDPLDPALPATVVAGDQVVTASVTDALSGAGRVAFYVDGQLRAADGAQPFSFVWHAGDESAGPHTLKLVGFDAAGNSASTSLDVLTVPTSTTGAMATVNSLASQLPGA